MPPKKKNQSRKSSSGPPKKTHTKKSSSPPVQLDDLSNIDQVPPLSKKFSRKHLFECFPNEHSLLGIILDIGSSYAKSSSCTVDKDLNIVPNHQPLSFSCASESSRPVETIPTSIYYDPTTKTYHVGSKPHSDDYVHLPSIKKLLTVANLKEFKPEGIDSPLTLVDIYHHLVEGLLDKLMVAKESNKISAEYSFAFVTIPTSTNDEVQLLIRNCVYQACRLKMKTPIRMEHIYIVEESIFIAYNDTLHRGNSLLCDLGFLSLDIAVIKDGVLVDHQAEIAGVEILHRILDQVLKEHELDLSSTTVLDHMFMHPKGQWKDFVDINARNVVKKAAEEAFKIILSPLFECLADYPYEVVLHGAIFSIEVFKTLATKILSKSNMRKYLTERKSYFLETKKPIDISVSTLGTSFGLTQGAVALVRAADRNEVSLEFQSKLLSKQPITGILSGSEIPGDPTKVKYGITLEKCLIEMNSKLDIEFVAVVFRSNRNIEVVKRESITEDNYWKLGITEFTRLFYLHIVVDPSIQPYADCPYFLIKTWIDEQNAIVVELYWVIDQFFKYSTRVDLQNKVEKLSVNDALERMFRPEPEETTWYGEPYRIDVPLSTNLSNVTVLTEEHTTDEVRRALQPKRKTKRFQDQQSKKRTKIQLQPLPRDDSGELENTTTRI
ncbi:hypothetical protein C9374_002335 [Naegleria lovaniensis]|uniref:Uncharacterized protein n=1 Tax=Naegleria lovaniensis TaxID=51637 RepID=A0AA88KMK3_NAELO|nr:uncharacterized protein C9374_002335 [Naegleria lovaniensis]KAG2386591.1 hypothetical protein C9374_002335 [Naegleria lovaniensis]